MYQSTGSLHSDGHSSNSMSPAPSPSPTNLKGILLFYFPYYFLNFGFTKFKLFFFIEFQVLIIPIITDLPLLEHLLQSCLLDLNHATYRAPCQIWPSPKNGARPVISGMRLQVLKFQTVVKWLIVGYNKLVR